jgi:hypothetical protein
MSSSRPTRQGRLWWLALTVLLAPPLHAQAVARYADDLEAMESKFTELAEAMGSGLYTWRPMEGVRSVSEQYMLAAAEGYAIPRSWGAEPPEGVDLSGNVFERMSAVTDKAEVVRHLKQAFAYYRRVVGNLSDEQLHSTIQFFGSERTVEDALYMMLGDLHEHLGKSIAYARMNHVVPPWTARAQANR